MILVLASCHVHRQLHGCHACQMSDCINRFYESATNCLRFADSIYANLQWNDVQWNDVGTTVSVILCCGPCTISVAGEALQIFVLVLQADVIIIMTVFSGISWIWHFWLGHQNFLIRLIGLLRLYDIWSTQNRVQSWWMRFLMTSCNKHNIESELY